MLTVRSRSRARGESRLLPRLREPRRGPDGRVWLKEPNIVCIHPGWAKLSGWGPVMESWARIFDNTFEMKFELDDIEVIISGDIAVAVVEENHHPERLRRPVAQPGDGDQRFPARRPQMVAGDTSRIAGGGAADGRAAASIALRARSQGENDDAQASRPGANRGADAAAAAQTIGAILGAEILRQDEVAALGARRTTIQAGSEPYRAAGAGRRRAGRRFHRSMGRRTFRGRLLGSNDIDAAARRLEGAGAAFKIAGGQLLVEPSATFGMRVGSEPVSRARPGRPDQVDLRGHQRDWRLARRGRALHQTVRARSVALRADHQP